MGRHRKLSFSEAENELTRMLNESGKKEEFKAKLLERLAETGWRDQVKLVILDLVQDQGAENVAIEDLVQEAAPKATALVGDSIRRDLTRDLKLFIKENQDDY